MVGQYPIFINDLKAALSLVSKSTWAYNLPLNLQIEPTTYCNLECLFCHYKIARKKKRHMDYVNYVKLVDEVRPRTVIFSGSGEPLLSPDIVEMVDYAQKNGLKTVMYTNLTLNSGKLEGLVVSGLQRLRISIEVDRETFRQVKRRDLFDNVMENIQHVNEAKLRHGLSFPKTGFECVVSNKNIENLSRVITLAREYRVNDINFRPLGLFGLEERRELLLGDQGGSNFINGLTHAKRVAEGFGITTNLQSLIRDWPSYVQIYEDPYRKLNHLCSRAWLQAFVSADGELTPCHALNFDLNVSLGNVFQNYFLRVWNGLAFQELRKGFRDKKLIYARCKYCQAEAPILYRLKYGIKNNLTSRKGVSFL
jgi:radical SAM protein with 4Fe4S-binding SPASM domain